MDTYVLSAIAASFMLFGVLIDWIWKQIISRYQQIMWKGHKPVPILGNVHHFERRPADLFKQLSTMMEENENISVLWLGARPLVVLGREEHVAFVLRDSKMLTKSGLYRFLHPWLETGLLTSTGTKWMQRRRLLTPAFHFSILKDFAEVFKNGADVLVQKLKPFAESGETFDISQAVTLCSLDVICETVMGVKVGAQDGRRSEYITAVLEISKLIQDRQRSPWLWPSFVYNAVPSGQTHNEHIRTLHQFTTEVINNRINTRSALRKEKSESLAESEQARKKLAFLDLILNGYEKGDIDVAGIREEVNTFMFEGHDTTSHGISWAMYCLGRHPEIQKQVQEEIDSLYVNDWQKLIDASKEMKLLERVIKESLRLYPPVPVIGREVEEDQKYGDDLQLYKGSSVVIFIYALHRNSKVWENPHKFDPDRFLPENCAKRNPFAYVPFSAGPRNCIGQRVALLEEKIILATFLRHYEIHAVDSEDDLDVSAEIITRAETGIKVQLKPRKSTRIS